MKKKLFELAPKNAIGFIVGISVLISIRGYKKIRRAKCVVEAYTDYVNEQVGIIETQNKKIHDIKHELDRLLNVIDLKDNKIDEQNRELLHNKMQSDIKNRRIDNLQFHSNQLENTVQELYREASNGKRKRK